MLEAAFAAAGMNARYLSLEIDPSDLANAIRGVRAMGFRGVHITAPHKVAVVSLLEATTNAAELAGAVNCIKRVGDGLVGDNTDGRGFVESLRALVDPRGIEAIVIGGGGAARAIVAELALAGAGRIVVVNRTLAAAQAIAEAAGTRTGVDCAAEQLTDEWLVPAGVDVVVQATTVGMGDATARLPLRWQAGDGAVAADVVINPPRTAFLEDAARHGLATIDGLGMLVEQAVIGFRWWTGREPDAAAMRAALVRELQLA
jgi:shikimate dehydrogenase